MLESKINAIGSHLLKSKNQQSFTVGLSMDAHLGQLPVFYTQKDLLFILRVAKISDSYSNKKQQDEASGQKTIKICKKCNLLELAPSLES